MRFERASKELPAGSSERKPKQRRQQHVKHRVLTQGTPSVASSIADAVVIKDEDVFFLAQPDGRVPLRTGHGFGLYFRDCRFLNGYEVKLADHNPVALVSTAARGFMAVFQLTNPDMKLNGKLLRKEQIGIQWERIIDSVHLTLYDLITFQNFEHQPVELPVYCSFRAGFEDVFAVRGLLSERLGKAHPPKWKNDILSFTYDGADGLFRSLAVEFSERPKVMKDRATARFQIKVKPRSSRQISILQAFRGSARSLDATASSLR